LRGDTLFLFADFIPGVTLSWSGGNGFNQTQNPGILNADSTYSTIYTVFAIGATDAQVTHADICDR